MLIGHLFIFLGQMFANGDWVSDFSALKWDNHYWWNTPIENKMWDQKPWLWTGDTCSWDLQPHVPLAPGTNSPVRPGGMVSTHRLLRSPLPASCRHALTAQCQPHCRETCSGWSMLTGRQFMRWSYSNGVSWHEVSDFLACGWCPALNSVPKKICSSPNPRCL